MPPKHSSRWTHDDENPGSIFHELVVLPTLAPQLARPEYLDATPGPVILPQPRSKQLAEGVTVVGQLPPAAGGDPANATPPLTAPSSANALVPGRSGSDELEEPDSQREFYLNVVLERTEATQTSRGPGKPRVVSETKPGPKLPVLALSRPEIVHRILEVHGQQERYLPGPVSGPPFRVTFKGHFGGARGAPVIRHDDDWSSFKGQLSESKVSCIQVVLASKDLEPYKNHKRPLSPDPIEESVYGTYVPNVQAYSGTQRELGAKIAAIKAAWPCVKHGHCFIDGDGQHITLNRFRLNGWGTALLTDHFDAADGPPEELLAEWKGVKPAIQPLVPKARGLNGSRSASSSSISADFSDFGSILTACAAPLFKSLATAAMSSLAPPRPSPHNAERLSSPPPAVEDELAACMKAFGAARSLSTDVLDKAVDSLDEVCYTPDIMSDVTAERLQALTGLPEGHAVALRKFARDWCGKVDAKRARRA